MFQAARRLWLRRLEAADAEALAGTESGRMPFWSPDSRAVAFFAQGLLERIDLASGFVRTLASAPTPRHGTWNADGTIVFGGAAMAPLSRVSAEGGAVSPATALLPGHTSHRWPQFLPDGRQFVLMALGTPETRGLYLGSLDDLRLRRVSDQEPAFAIVSAEHLLVAREGALLSRRLMLGPRGPVPVGGLSSVAPRILVDDEATGLAALATSPAGHIAYRAATESLQLVWLDRAGRRVGTVGDPDAAQMRLYDLSRDGRTAAVSRMVNGNKGLWLTDTGRGVPRRFTTDPAWDGASIFSPDGTRVAYMSDGHADVWDRLYERAADGTGEAAPSFAFAVPDNHYPEHWSLDGRFLLYLQEARESADLWALPLSGERRPIEVAATRFNEWNGQFSPDGRWVACQSDQSGRPEVYVQSFPEGGPRLQVSTGGGVRPIWNAAGDELFFVEPATGRVMAVSVTPRAGTLDWGTPRARSPSRRTLGRGDSRSHLTASGFCS